MCAWAEGTGTLGRKIDALTLEAAETLARPVKHCQDCCEVTPCICEIALATEWRMTHAEQLHEALEGRR